MTFPQPAVYVEPQEQDCHGGAVIGAIYGVVFFLFTFGLPIALMWLAGRR
jgi:hypothetical protein